SESQLNASSLKEALERFNHSRTPSASSRSSRKSSHTAMFQQNGAEGLNLTSAQTPHGSVGQQGGALSMQGQVVPAAPLQNSIQQQLPVQAQSQQQTLLRDQSTALAQSLVDDYHSHFSWSGDGPCFLLIKLILPDLRPLYRFPTAPQLLTKLVTGQIPCGAVMVPTTMFMGQVVTAFAPQQGQTQAISISQQQQQQVQAQSQVSALQVGRAQLAPQQPQFLQV
ncbi:hypothetical protein GOODEAATRI_007065, partial [Goodea atripinnis]